MVSVGVIDRLEVIDICKQNAQGLARAFAARQVAFQPFDDGGAAEDAAEIIVTGLVLSVASA